MDSLFSPASAVVPCARDLDAVKLTFRCAEHPDDHELWSEFLRRFTPKIKLFIRGTLRRSANGGLNAPSDPALLSGATETDLFQNVIVRLVDNGCAALKRFSGSTEEDLNAYFAVIARSAVRDFLRRQRALKRPRLQESGISDTRNWLELATSERTGAGFTIEQEILARELEQLGLQVIKNHSGESAERDRLIFQLYFCDGLTTTQISRCAGIDLSRTGVEKVIERLKTRVRSAATGAHLIEAIAG